MLLLQDHNALTTCQVNRVQPRIVAEARTIFLTRLNLVKAKLMIPPNFLVNVALNGSQSAIGIRSRLLVGENEVGPR